MSQPKSPAQSRVGWIDSVRAIGIFLMFYGHVLQKSVSADNRAAADQQLFIYSFHMPLFFVMAGFFFKPAKDLVTRLRHLALRRLLPVFFFSAIMVPLWLHGEVLTSPSPRKVVVEMLLQYVNGRPDLNWPTWFLVCLFVCEVLAVFTLGKIRHRLLQLAFGFACIFGGVYFCQRSFTPEAGALYSLGHSWFFSEAIVALGFYSIGYVIYPALDRIGRDFRLDGGLFLGGVVLVLVTFRLNPSAGESVMMAARRHGQALPFVFTALAGTAASIGAGGLLAGFLRLQTIGRDTLPLLGLNGLFFRHLNPMIGRRLHFPEQPLLFTLVTVAVTLASLAVCMPFVFLINKYLPQLIGKSGQSGPWLPALEGTKKS